MARFKDEKGVAPKVGAAAFGVALTLPMGLAAPADAMNACACGGGSAPATAADPADAPDPANAQATRQPPPRRPVTPAPTGPPPGTTVRQLDNETPAPDPEPAPAPPRGGHPTRPAERAPEPPASEPPVQGPRGGHPTRPARPTPEPPASQPPVQGPRGGHPTRPASPAEPAPEPPAENPQGGHPTRPEGPRTAVDELMDSATSSDSQAEPDVDDLLTGGVEPDGPPAAEEPAQQGPRGGHPTRPEGPRNAVDELIENVTDSEPQPEPSRYLSDMVLPGVDLGTQPAPPPPQYVDPRPQRPGESDVEYLLTSPLDEPRPEPKPIGPAPDLSDRDPIAQDEFIAENPLSQPYYTEAERAAARQRLAEDELVVDELLSPADDRNPQRNEFRMEHADPLPPPPEAEPEDEDMSGIDVFQEGLSYGGFIPGLGAVPDLINAPIYAVRGKWGDAAWSLGAAVPIVGDGANGIRKGRKIYRAIDEAADAGDTINDARRVVGHGSPEAATDKFLSTRPKIDDSDESVAALDAIMRRTTSGTRANASHPGQFNPVHTRGHSSELRTLDDLGARGDVTAITPVPAARGSRTPDFVVTRADGSQVRVEVTTVTGAPRGRVDRGLGGAAPPTRRDIENAISRKTSTSSSTPNQFQADLGDVPTGGTLAVHLRGGGSAQMADDAVAAQAAGLRKSGVNQVEVYTSDRQVLTYTRQADGSYTR